MVLAPFLHCLFRINRNILECKLLSDELIKLPLHCINRNILECKLVLLVQLQTFAYGINRNILECKFYSLRSKWKLALVLIETYWNVNEDIIKEMDARGESINRNILECKWVSR